MEMIDAMHTSSGAASAHRSRCAAWWRVPARVAGIASGIAISHRSLLRARLIPAGGWPAMTKPDMRGAMLPDHGLSWVDRDASGRRAMLTEILAQVSREALQGEGLEAVLQGIVDCLVRRLPV